MYPQVLEFLTELLRTDELSAEEFDGVLTLPMEGAPEDVSTAVDAVLFAWGCYGRPPYPQA